jgi:exosortase/archaeosortase family protein
MNIRALAIFKSKRNLILLGAILLFMILIGLFLYPPINVFLWNLINEYLLLLERIADRLLYLLGSEVSILENQVYLETGLIGKIDSGYLLKKWTLFLLIVCWITPTKVRGKLVFTGLIILSNFIGSLSHISLSAHLLSLDIDSHSTTLLGRTPYAFLMLTLFITWIWNNRKSIMHTRLVKKLNLEFLERILPEIFIIMFLFTLLSNFLLGFFQYSVWIDFMFNISAWILNILDYPAWVESHLLKGENGSIYMAKGCLGFNTMLLFASIVYITGKHKSIKWLFIVSGLILLNITNITRFVLLFIHIQNHGGYVLKMDVHAMYNYIIYVIVFLFWIIWFEKYSDFIVPKKESA